MLINVSKGILCDVGNSYVGKHIESQEGSTDVKYVGVDGG